MPANTPGEVDLPSPSAQWNDCLASFAASHILQTWQWGEFKAYSGWQAHRYAWLLRPGGRLEAVSFSGEIVQSTQIAALAQLLVRMIQVGPFRLPLGVAYCPKGPILDWSAPGLWEHILADLRTLALSHGAIFLKIDPDVRVGVGTPGEPTAADDPAGLQIQARLADSGWLFSPDQVQFRNTFLLDLAPEEDVLLAQMKQKTRYNIRLAERKGVRVRPGTPLDLPMLFKMYAETATRDGFVIREPGYYLALWNSFLSVGFLEPLVAEVEGEPVAGVMIFRFGRAAYYMHGMSRDAHRNLMPAYLLQWEAIRRAKAAGCLVYDLWGAPNVFDENDPLHGVYRFKQGLGGQVVRTLGAWDYPLRPGLYRLYTRVIPRVLDWMRRRGRAATRQIALGQSSTD